MTAPIRSMPELVPLATIRTQDDLIEAMRLAKAMRGLSNEFCDLRGGIAKGHTDKALGPSRAKTLSPMLFDLFACLFAVKFIMVPDPEAEEQMKAIWEGRDVSNVRLTHRMSKQLIERARPHVFKEMSELASIARKDIPREVRVKIARKAITTRWRNQRQREREQRLNQKQKEQA